MIREVRRSSQQGNATAAEHAAAYRRLRGLPEPAEETYDLAGLPPRWLRYGEVMLSLFWVLGEGRQCGLGPSPISWGDLNTWSELMNLTLRPLEVNLLRVMDLAALAGHRETQSG